MDENHPKRRKDKYNPYTIGTTDDGRHWLTFSDGQGIRHHFEISNVVFDALNTMDFEVTPHQLRHTYITNLLYAGVDPKTVQYLAGHENSKTTMDIYAKVKYNRPEELIGVVNRALT